MIYTVEYSKEALFTSYHRSRPHLYDIYDDRVSVLIVQAEEHYNDK